MLLPSEDSKAGVAGRLPQRPGTPAGPRGRRRLRPAVDWVDVLERDRPSPHLRAELTPGAPALAAGLGSDPGTSAGVQR